MAECWVTRFYPCVSLNKRINRMNGNSRPRLQQFLVPIERVPDNQFHDQREAARSSTKPRSLPS